MWWTRSVAAVAETRKAEGASYTVLLMLSPPIFTSSVSCAYAVSSSWKSMSVMPLLVEFKSSLYF